MIHIATTHFNSVPWVARQNHRLREYIRAPFRVYGALQGIPHELEKYFYRHIAAVRSHPRNLNALSDLILREAAPDDILIFIDSDAFPVAGLDVYLHEKLAQYPLVAVQRLENWFDPFPHPLFCATRVKTWRELGGDWEKGPTENSFATISDVGGALNAILKGRGTSWYAMRKSNRSPHGTLFSVYDGVIYHHGAGSRRPITRYDLFTVNRKFPSGLSNALASWRVLKNIDAGANFLENLATMPATFSHRWTQTRTVGPETTVELGLNVARLFNGDGAIRELNDHLLTALGGSWKSPPRSAKFGWRDHLRVFRFLKRKRIAFLDDPRLVLTLPAWNRAIRNPRYVFTLSDSLATAQALQMDFGLSLEEGLILWRSYYRRLVAYAHLLGGPIEWRMEKNRAFHSESLPPGSKRSSSQGMLFSLSSLVSSLS